MTILFSIIVPAYNEGKNIPYILHEFSLLHTQYGKKYPFQLILVNNGSTDDSRDVIQRLCESSEYPFVRVVHVSQNIGYGHGIMSGLRQAEGEYLCWTHADLQTSAEDCFTALERLLSSCDPLHSIVKGRRVGRRFSQWFFTFGMSILATMVLGHLLYDVNAQPKVFHRSFLRHMIAAPDDYSLDLYWLYHAKKNDYALVTIPVYFGIRRYGVSKWAFSFHSRLRTIWRTICYIFRLRSLLAFHAVDHSSR